MTMPVHRHRPHFRRTLSQKMGHIKWNPDFEFVYDDLGVRHDSLMDATEEILRGEESR